MQISARLGVKGAMDPVASFNDDGYFAYRSNNSLSLVKPSSPVPSS